MNDALEVIIRSIDAGQDLSHDVAKEAFYIIMSGESDKDQIIKFLLSLKNKGETTIEISAAAQCIREKMQRVNVPQGAIDIVGTGGDKKGTLNISTATAFVVAACGVTVAKHGNKSVSSKSGASDVLSCLGVNINAPSSVAEKAIKEIGIGFLMAPLYHPAFRFVGPARAEIADKTIFNLLGPLCNPGSVTRQMSGAYAKELIKPMAEVLGELGSERVWVVHGSDGMDELTITGPSYVAEYVQGTGVTEFVLDPTDYGLALGHEEDLKGGDGVYNAAAMERLFAGEKGAYRDVVLLNAAASLVVSGKITDMKAAITAASNAIDSGEAKAKLQKLVEITNESAVDE